MIKNFLRINKNLTEFNNKIWPDIYSESGNYDINDFKLNKKNKKNLYYFSSGKLCMYSKSPCTHFGVRVKKNKIFNYYEVYYSQKKKINYTCAIYITYYILSII